MSGIAAPKAMPITYTLRPTSQAPRLARQAVHSACRGLDLPAKVVDDASFVAGELVTNSIRQSRQRIRLAVLAEPDQVTLRVRDATREPPDSTGWNSVGALRHWEVVKRLSSSFGYRNVGTGRHVWAALRVPST